MKRGISAVLACGALALAGACGRGPERLELPRGFPADVPLPPERVLRQSQEMRPGWLNVVLETGRDRAWTGEFYRREMARLGWREMAAVEDGGGRFVGYQKEERVTTIGVGVTETGTLVSIGCAAH